MSCTKYKHKRINQYATWLADLPEWLPFFHVIGGTEAEEHIRTKNSQEFVIDAANRILYVRAPDDYNGLPQKVAAAFVAIRATYMFDYLFKTDDDQVMTAGTTPQKYFAALRACLAIKRPNYGGFVVDVKADHVSQYYRIHHELPNNILVQRGQYCNGRFYILSEKAVQELIRQREQFKSEYFEDYAVGKLLPDELKYPIFEIDTNRNFCDMPNNIII